MDKYVTIYRSPNSLKLDLVVLKLKQREVPYRLFNQELSRVLPIQAMMPELQVPESYLPKVKDIISDLEVTELENQISPDDDGIDDVKEIKRKYALAIIVLALAFILMVIIKILKS